MEMNVHFDADKVQIRGLPHSAKFIDDKILIKQL